MNFSQLIDEVESNAERASKRNENDYIQDGLLYCGNCNTPKQCRVEIFGKIRKPYCMCKCEAERFKAIEKAEKIEAKRFEVFGYSELSKWTFAADDRKNERLTNAMQKYVDNFAELKKSGQGLLLYGDVGRGKTYAAAEVANALIDNGYSVYVTNFARIANEVSGMFEGKQNYYDSFNKYSLLVLDDLAAERKTEYMQEIVYSVIDSRYRSGKPMIITTNLTGAELKKPSEVTNKRIYDRILEKCHPIEVTGSNRRHETTSANYSELNNLLGL